MLYGLRLRSRGAGGLARLGAPEFTGSLSLRRFVYGLRDLETVRRLEPRAGLRDRLLPLLLGARSRSSFRRERWSGLTLREPVKLRCLRGGGERLRFEERPFGGGDRRFLGGEREREGDPDAFVEMVDTEPESELYEETERDRFREASWSSSCLRFEDPFRSMSPFLQRPQLTVLTYSEKKTPSHSLLRLRLRWLRLGELGHKLWIVELLRPGRPGSVRPLLLLRRALIAVMACNRSAKATLFMPFLLTLIYLAEGIFGTASKRMLLRAPRPDIDSSLRAALDSSMQYRLHLCRFVGSQA